MNTVNQFYGDIGSSYAYAMYNDEPPNAPENDDRAHSKGAILFNGEQGFWLVHSIPKWPGALSQGYQEPSQKTWSITYAQSLMCTSFHIDRLDDIAEIQMVQWPTVYSANISSDLAAEHPQFALWISGEKTIWHKNKTKTKTTPLVSYNGRHMTHFAKSEYCECDLWGDVVAPGLPANMRTETWQNGDGGKLPDYCSPTYNYSATNITNIAMRDGVSWKETQDHSKWGVSDSEGRTVCIGDINRQESQADRGGGALCYNNKELFETFDSIVESEYFCGSDKLKDHAASAPSAL